MKKFIFFVVSLILILLNTIVIRPQQPTKAELIVETGHTDSITKVVFSPDGKLLASSSFDRTVKLWDVTTKRELRTFLGHKDLIWSLAFSPDGQMIASGSLQTIKIWDIKTGREIKSLNGHTHNVYSISFSPNGKTIASGGGDQSVRIWDLFTGKEIQRFTNTSEYDDVFSVIYSPNGQILASGNKFGNVRIWNTSNWTELRTLKSQFNEELKQKLEVFKNPNIYNEIKALAFSPNGKLIASGNHGNAEIWDVETGEEIYNLVGHEKFRDVTSISFSPDGKILATGSEDKTIKLWDVETGKESKTLIGHSWKVLSVAFSPDGKTLASSSGVLFSEDSDNTIKFWDVAIGKEFTSLKVHTKETKSVAFSFDGKTLASAHLDSIIRIWSLSSGNKVIPLIDKSELGVYTPGNGSYLKSTSNGVTFSPDGKMLASANNDSTIKLWDIETGKKLKELEGHSNEVNCVVFSPDGKILVSGSKDSTIILWDTVSHKELRTFEANDELIWAVAFSPNGKILASGHYQTIKLWDINTGKVLKTLQGHEFGINNIAFSPDGKRLITSDHDINDLDNTSDSETIKLWEIATGRLLDSHPKNKIDAKNKFLSLFPQFFQNDNNEPTFRNSKFQFKKGETGKLNIVDLQTRQIIATLLTLDEKEWAVVTPNGRFDTNKILEKIEGLHWIVSDNPLKPLPIDTFLRQYYEPNLLPRLLKCTEENNCDKEFKPLPSIAEINRVQPNIKIKEIKPVANSADLADVTIEVENVTDEVSLSATDQTQNKQLSSGVYDLRLFRDGQLVGVSTPKDKLAQFIADAPRLVAENKASGKLIDTPEDKAWREANDIFKIKAENVKQVSPTKIEYTFRNIKLPRDGRKEVEFTAYAFNSDKVKSTTTEPFKFTIPETMAKTPKKGRAYLISIGVNASENQAYNLRYAVNDARKMQEVVGERLKANSEKYAEIVQVPLVSDYGQDGNLSVNTAQKGIIKGVFSLLSGNEKEVPLEILRQIPNQEKIKPIEPEDTLLITYSGHGYTDQSGIFYILPYDIGKETTQLTPEVLKKTISSDELSLWMQDITAAEMIMIIDACHSSAAVQGDGFKPGPMGSRGLGQLAYDKDMKILSATQADNVALELGSLQQGLLSYALIQNGIVEAKADADKNKQLFTTEWLSYAEKRVPELYQEVKDGKRGVVVDGKNIAAGAKGAEIVVINPKQKSNLNLQQPSLFDFKRRKADTNLMALP